MCGCGSLVVKVSDHGRHVTTSSQLPQKTRRVGERCTLNLSRAQTCSRWCGVVVRRERVPAQVLSSSLEHGSKGAYEAKSPRVAEQCDSTIHSLTRYRKRFSNQTIY
ncbi:uncharacterized protein TNCV_2032911 [Trichonephila clavipes]|nr:uncharacterized protein TNCV_2032911 [Trichonephila clavipes]